MSDYFVMHRGTLADPMRTVQSIQWNAFIIGDDGDRSVPPVAWNAAARLRVLRVFNAEVAGSDYPELIAECANDRSLFSQVPWMLLGTGRALGSGIAAGGQPCPALAG